MKKLNLKVEPESNQNLRLDVYLTHILNEKTRSFIQNIIKDGNVKVNGTIKKSNYRINLNDSIDVIIPDALSINVLPQNIPLNILYEDHDIIVVDKPQGMVVHPANGNHENTLVNALLFHCTDLSGINGMLRPGIVHRIDKNTSGILVVAKNDNAHVKLSKQLKDHSMKRVYKAIVEGIIKDDTGKIDAPLGRNRNDRIKYAVVSDGKRAVTHFNVIERFKKNTCVALRLETGRTHQIRVHMAYIGHPLVGDDVYGFKKQKFNLKGQILHAEVLGFIHPTTGKYMEFNSPIPEYFENIIDLLRKNE